MGKSLMLVCSLAMLAAFLTSFGEEKIIETAPGNTEREPAESSSPGVTLKTTHYDLYVERIDANEVGLLLEAAHPQFTAFFGKSPTDRLRLQIWSDKERYRAAVLREGQEEETNGVEAAGCYLTSTKTAYLWPQASGYLTRKTILHEAAHQFHFITGTTNVWPRLKAYPEGLAEHFALHTWNGKILNMGVLPRIAIPDYPSIALENFRTKHQRDFKGLMSGKRQADYPDYWAAICYLLSEHRPQTSAWMARLNESTATFAQTHPLIAWNSIFGQIGSDFPQSFEKWLASRQQPWTVVSGDWEDTGREIVGRSRSPKLSIATLKTTPAKLQVLLPELHGEDSAGLVFNFQPDGSFQLLRLRADRELALIEAKPGEWIAKEEWILPDRSTHLFNVVFTNGEIAVMHDEQELCRLAHKAPPGIFVEQGDIKFVVNTESAVN